MYKHLPPRWDAQEAWYFVTVVTHKRSPYFESEDACLILLDACRSVRERHPYRMGALMILPDHWHALIKPLGNEVVESIVGSIKQRVFHASRQKGSPTFHPHGTSSHPDGCAAFHLYGTSSEPNGSAAFHGGVAGQIIRWQPRFMDHRIRNEADYFQHIEYMRLNPSKHQLVTKETEPWRWWFVHQDPFG